MKYERVTRDLVHKIFASHIQKGEPLVENALDGSLDNQAEPASSCSAKAGAAPPAQTLQARLRPQAQGGRRPRRRLKTAHVRCFGACSEETEGKCTHVLVQPDQVLYRISTEKDLDEILASHVMQGGVRWSA